MIKLWKNKIVLFIAIMMSLVLVIKVDLYAEKGWQYDPEDIKNFDYLYSAKYPKTFSDDRKEVLNMISELDGKNPDEGIQITENKGTYKQTTKFTGLYYFGKLKNNKPDGKGVICESIAGVMYAGSFKEGQYDGYGIEFGFRNLAREGIYKKGLLDGKGIVYHSVGTIMGTYTEDVINSKYLIVTPSVRYEGQFKKGIPDGKMCEYIPLYEFETHVPEKNSDSNYGQLRYDGSMRKGQYDGKGKLYYENGQLQYEGEFKKGKYDGKGILYNEDGSINYKGKFKKGDVK